MLSESESRGAFSKSPFKVVTFQTSSLDCLCQRAKSAQSGFPSRAALLSFSPRAPGQGRGLWERELLPERGAQLPGDPQHARHAGVSAEAEGGGVPHHRWSALALLRGFHTLAGVHQGKEPSCLCQISSLSLSLSLSCLPPPFPPQLKSQLSNLPKYCANYGCGSNVRVGSINQLLIKAQAPTVILICFLCLFLWRPIEPHGGFLWILSPW